MDVDRINETSYTNSIGAFENYLDHFKFCSRNPVSPRDSTGLHHSCLGRYGGPVEPAVALGGFSLDTKDGEEPAYKDANTAIITYVVNNNVDKSKLENTMKWESKYLELMANYTRDNMTDWMDIAYSAERSIEDELDRESKGEFVTVAISYVIMFLYIAVNLGQINSFSRLMVCMTFICFRQLLCEDLHHQHGIFFYMCVVWFAYRLTAKFL